MTAKNEIVSYKEQMAKRGRSAVVVEAPTANRISFYEGENGWSMKADKQDIGKSILCYVLSNRRTNTWYATAYNPDVVDAPDCWAVFRKEEEINAAPDERCTNPQNDRCATCAKNAFGSAANGKGKACGNRRRLALLPAGGYDPKSQQYIYSNDAQLNEAAIYSCNIPPTSDKAFMEFVRKCSNQYNRSTDGVIAIMKIVPDPKSRYRITFESVVAPDDDSILEVLATKYEQAEQSIDYGFEIVAKDEAPFVADPAKPVAPPIPNSRKRF